MINILDIIIAVLILIYMVKRAGGVLKTLKNIVVVVLALILFAIIARLTLEVSLLKLTHPYIRDSYFYNISVSLIRWVYPPIKESAPRVDLFVKEKFISRGEVERNKSEGNITKISLPENLIPKVTLPVKGLLKLSFPSEEKKK
jgi:hypothetical protein